MEVNSLKTRLSKLTVNKKYFVVSIKLFIGFGLLWFIISKINPSEIITSIKNANLFFLIAAFSLVVLNLYIQFKKWHLTCVNILDEQDKKKALYSLFFGIAGGSFTPIRAGEYFGRAIEYKDKSFIQVSVATLIDKLFLLIILTFAGSVASILFIKIYYNVTIYISLALFAVIFVLFYLLVILLLSKKFWNYLSFDFFKSSKRLGTFFERLKIITELDRQYSAKMIILSLLLYSCYTFQFALLVAGFSNHYRLLHYLWAGNLVMFAKTIIPSISFAEIGIREGASIFFLTRMGELSSAAFSASIFLLIINIILPSVIGLLLLFKKNNA